MLGIKQREAILESQQKMDERLGRLSQEPNLFQNMYIVWTGDDDHVCVYERRKNAWVKG